MTGFARTDGEADGISWAWELKSVNSRSLDLRLRLPLGFDGLEPALRASLARLCRRGNVSASLSVNRTVPPTIRINREMLAQVIALARDCGGSDRGRAAAARRSDRAARDRRDGRGRSGAGRRSPARRRDGGLGVGAAPAGRSAGRGGSATVHGAVDTASRACGARRSSAASCAATQGPAIRARLETLLAELAGLAPKDARGAGRSGTGDAGHPRRCPRGA